MELFSVEPFSQFEQSSFAEIVTYFKGRYVVVFHGKGADSRRIDSIFTHVCSARGRIKGA